jgi:acryloyl-coenzyme A reductase
VKLGECVLVTGASGGVGLPAVQIAKAAGASVIALTRSPSKAAALAEAGATHVLVAVDGSDFSADVRKLIGDEGADVVVDTVGSKVFTPAFRSLAIGGRYLVIGQLTREDIAINPARIIFKAVTISGITSARRDQLEDTVRLVASGVLRSHVAKVMPLAEAAQAHALVETGGVVGRVVLQP